jgi:hypothetical protein
MLRCLSPTTLVVCLLAVGTSTAQDHTIFPSDDPQTVSITSETGNNTSACAAAGNPSYCTAPLPNLVTTSANKSAGAQTVTVDSFPEHVSTISSHRLMYPRWTGQLICEYQPWFVPNNGHIDVGYNENLQTTVSYQDTHMLASGCNINLIDFYGSTDNSKLNNLNTTMAI